MAQLLALGARADWANASDDLQAMIDADFDGDQVAVTRLKSVEAIQECGERLTIAGRGHASV